MRQAHTATQELKRIPGLDMWSSVNLAFRIDTSCAPGDIYVSEEACEIFHDEFATDLAREFELEGLAGKTLLYKLAVGTE